MKVRFSSIALLVLGLSWTAMAQSSASPMRAGNWEVSMTMPGMEGSPAMKQTQCVTDAMLKDPNGAMPQGPGADCKMTNQKMDGNTATYNFSCTQPMPLTGTGVLKYSGTDAYTGTLTLDMGGQNLVLGVDAKRVGDCPK